MFSRVVILLLGACALAACYEAEIVYEFPWLNFTFQSQQEYTDYIDLGYYKNCMLAGIKVAPDGRKFVSVPRWKAGVPATLSVLNTDTSPPRFQPYPSWKANEVGDPLALQSVLGYEIDPLNRLWVLDQGKVNGQPAIAGSLKLVIFDLETDKIIQEYFFSEEEASLTNSFLNDVVVDLKHNFAYITDSGISTDPNGEVDGGILVYDFERNSARRVLDRTVNTQANKTIWFSINGDKVLENAPMRTGADGIALSPTGDTLYFNPLTSRNLYKIDTAILRDFNASQSEILEHVELHFEKGTTSDGLVASNEPGDIIYGSALEKNGVFRLGANALELVAQDNKLMVWPDTLGFDTTGYLYWSTNQLHLFVEGVLKYQTPTFRIWRQYFGVKSYLYPDDKSSVNSAY